MTERDETKADAERDSATRERDDVAAPDAPTSGEENEGHSTVLSAEPLTGVQSDASEE